MGSRREITLFLVSLCVVAGTLAKPQLHEERREYQYQRSSKVLSSTGPGYYNSASGNYDNSNLDEWTQNNKAHVQGMAEKLRSQLDTTEDARRTATYDCNVRCANLPGFTGKTREEIDLLAKDMTSQIIEDMHSGKLDRSKVNQPQWFEQRVAQKLEELHRQHMSQYEQNVYTTANRFRQNNAANNVYEARTDQDDLQQSQQNVFNEEDLGQVQQTISNQQQSQQQGGYYQQQSQNQHHTVYTRPVVVIPGTHYVYTQTANREQTVRNPPPPPPRTYVATELETANHVNEERHQTIYPTPVIRIDSEREEQNSTRSQTNGGFIVRPTLTSHNTFEHRETESHDRDEGQLTQPIDRTFTREESDYERRQQPTVPRYGTESTYESRDEFEESRRKEFDRPSQQTYHTSSTTQEESERRTPPLILPSQQHSVITNNSTTEERTRVPVRPSYPSGYNRQESTNEERRQYNRTTYVQPTRSSVYTERRKDTEYEQRTVQAQTPAPVAVQSKHSIYNHLEETDVVPNYRPRVVIDRNTEFQVLNQHSDTEIDQVQLREEQIYTERVNRLKEDLMRYGVPILTQPQYNATIALGSFEKDGYRYQYNSGSGHFERSERLETSEYNHTSSGSSSHPSYVTEITDEEYVERLSIVRNQLAALGYNSLSDDMYNATVFSGGFTHNGFRYLYNANTRRYEQSDRIDLEDSQVNVRPDYESGSSYDQHTEPAIQVIPLHQRAYEIISDEQYTERLEQIRKALQRLGYTMVTEDVYNMTIFNGGFKHNGYKYVWNANNRRYENSGHPETSEQEYENINREVQRQLQLIGFGEMSSQELNQTMSTGIFIRGGCKYIYNAGTEQYDKFTIEEDEKNNIYLRIKEILKSFGYRQISQRENEAVLQQGQLIRGGYRWYYNAQGGTLEKSDYVGENAELTEDEYALIYRKVQETLRSIGYGQMSRQQCNATISSGSFERGGIFWLYNADEAKFERVDLSQNEYRDRLNVLRYVLGQIGHRNLSAEEYRATVYKGYFHHGGYRYEYNSQTARFEKIELSDEEYQERLIRLKEQLVRIGFGSMTESLCNETISNGVFYFGGYEWLYNFETGTYDMGQRSDRDQSVNADGVQGTLNLDRGQYDSTQVDNSNGTSSGRRQYGEISKNRGDQPPQHFNEDYESEEILEQEPGLGFYATDKKPEIGLAKPGSYNQIAAPTTQSTRPNIPHSYNAERERQSFESQRTIVPVIPAVAHSEYERRYQRTQTSYVSSGMMPVQYATQQTLPNDERVEDLSDPQPTYAYATEVYTVGSDIDRPRNRRPAINPKRRSPSDAEDAPRVNTQKHDQLEDLGQTIENVGDDGQQVQRTEDLTQQLVDMDQPSDADRQQSEDLRQRQESEDLKALQREYDLLQNQQRSEDMHQRNEDVGQHFETEDLRQQHETEDYRQLQENPEDLRQQHEEVMQQNSYSVNAQNIRSGAALHDDEQQAEVVEVTTDKVEEKPGLWRRLKDKTKDIFG